LPTKSASSLAEAPIFFEPDQLLGDESSNPVQKEAPSSFIANKATLGLGQLSTTRDNVIEPPVSFEIVHSTNDSVARKPPILICGQTSSVGVLLGLVVDVAEGIRVAVAVLVEVGGRVAVAVRVALGTAVGVRDGDGVIEGVTPGGSVAVREGVVVALGTSVLVPPTIAAAVLVWIEMAVAV
jgi:hypothetical protein